MGLSYELAETLAHHRSVVTSLADKPLLELLKLLKRLLVLPQGQPEVSVEGFLAS